MAKSREKLQIDVPDAQRDRPHFGRIGGIAAAGFAVGLLLPALTGKRFVPEPPPEDRMPTAAEAESADEEEAPPPAAKAAPADAPKPEEPEEQVQTARVQPGKPLVLSCTDKAGNKVAKCDDLDLSQTVEARLLNLANCEGTEDASGTLSIGFEIDFGKKKIERILRGKSTTIAEAPAQKLYACADKEFETASVDGVDHEHTGYTVFYKAQLFPPGNKPTAEKPEDTANEASGLATVVWNSAVIRSKPDKDSDRLASILRGTRVTVTGKSDNWYKIKYDASGSEGWVYKDAIGM